ncbi:AAA family ATPase [Spongiimicrobium sp. 3-5]|uniref:AAA family ATPase n=1 Tax=Spongiimicrobium sp. 3-5 TaxID=3332596 RepID=UPI003980281C
MKHKTIYLLIGPKGSGKSFIGEVMQKELGTHFVRVEDWAKKIREDSNIEDVSYLKEVFKSIEIGIRKELIEYNHIVFESTGLTEHFDQMLENLNRDFRVITIGVKANHDICLERVKKRDQSIHINLSDEMVKRINQQVRAKKIDTDYTIVNEDKTRAQLKSELRLIINNQTTL